MLPRQVAGVVIKNMGVPRREQETSLQQVARNIFAHPRSRAREGQNCPPPQLNASSGFQFPKAVLPEVSDC
jgi:hypothetical protein